MKFKSKIDWWYYLVVFVFAADTAFLIASGFTGNVSQLKALSIIFLLIFLLLIFPILLLSYCMLESESLYIRCGLLRLRIPYRNIISVKKTDDPSSSMAPSLDRLGIEYKTHTGKNYVMVAPKEKEKFISELRKRNFDILYKVE